MEELKGKRTISNTWKLVTRSQTDPFEGMPLHLKEKILMKLKAKIISTFILLSKSWSSIVLNKDFTNMYLIIKFFESLNRPRLLLAVDDREINMHFFHSCSQEDPSSDHQTVDCYPDSYPRIWYDFSPPVRGLICCLNNSTKVVIGNPTTCQFETLPRVRTKIYQEIFPFFGYDHVKDEYKVLCMTISDEYYSRSGNIVSKEHKVFTLGCKQKKWRMIECTINHYLTPGTQGIFSNGVIYYFARVNDDQSLMCFVVGSEKFSVVELPRPAVEILANYGEKIAVTNLLYASNDRLFVWILEDASKQEWSNFCVLVPYWVDI
ncbi:putative F-box protein [Arabidopsis thaliana]